MGVDLTAHNRTDEIYGVLVDVWDLNKEYGRVDIGQGSLSSNYYTDDRITGELAVPPGFPDVGNRMLRIYYLTELDGKSERIVLGTFYMRRTGGEVSDGATTRSIELHSAAWQHINSINYYGNTYRSGTSALNALKTEIATSKGTEKFAVAAGVKDIPVRDMIVIKPGDTEYSGEAALAEYLDCELMPDKNGRLVCQPYIPFDKRPIAWTFEDGINCAYTGDFKVDTNVDDIPTDVCIDYNQADFSYKTFKELPASSPYSLYQRGRYVTAYFSYSELPFTMGYWTECVRACKLYKSKDTNSEVLHDLWVGGGFYTNKPQEDEWLWVYNWYDGASHSGWAEARNFFCKESVNRKCAEYYNKMVSLAISVEFEHYYAPIKIGDRVRFKRGSADFTGIVHAQEMTLEEGLRTSTVIDVLGGALYGITP